MWEEKRNISQTRKRKMQTENIGCDTIYVTSNQNEKNPEIDIGKIKGIYKIINKINGKYYVGSSKDINERWHSHKYFLNKNCHKNDFLQNAWNKHGEENFEFVIIEHLSNNITQKTLLKIEQKYLDLANVEKYKCYNLSFKSTGGELSPYSKSKISTKNSGTNNGFFGKKHSNDSIIKMQEKRKSRIGCLAPNYGKKHSKDTINIYKSKRKGELNSSYDKVEYTLQHENTNQIIHGTMYNLRNQYKFNRKCLSKLINGRIKYYKKWRCLNPKH